MKKQKILVTGSTGLLGVSLVDYLKAQGHEVLRHANQKPADFNFDLSNLEQSQKALESQNFNFAINLVAETNVDKCNQDPQQAYLLNIKATENISRICAGKSAFLIQISTDHIYDGPGPHSEDDLTFRNMYATSKYSGELACRFGPTAILRTNFFGKSRHETRKSFSDTIVENLKQSREMTVFNDVFFNPLSMATLVRAIARVLENPQAGIFNLGSREGLSKAEFAFKFAELLDLSPAKFKSASIDTLTQLVPRPKDMRMNVDHFQKTFDFTLPTLTQEIMSQGADYARV